MVHLSNPTTIVIMSFYSLLTFFIGPLITRPLDDIQTNVLLDFY